MGCSIKKLTEDSRIPISSYKDCFKILLCENPLEDCYFGKCKECPKSNDLQEFLESIFVLLFCYHMHLLQYINLLSQEMKLDLKDGEFDVIADFAENYAFTVQDAVPSFHWNNDQATLYNIVIYYKEDGTVKHTSLVIISDCLTHDRLQFTLSTKFYWTF